MNDLVKALREESIKCGDVGLTEASDLMKDAADKIELIESLAGAVTPGQSVADIKEHLRGLKKDKPDGSREATAV